MSKKSFEYKNIRLTVDYEEDYLLVEKIVDYFNSKSKISIDKINSLYISNPSFFKINKQAQQTKIGGKVVENLTLIIPNKNDSDIISVNFDDVENYLINRLKILRF